MVDGVEGHLKHGDKPACIPAGMAPGATTSVMSHMPKQGMHGFARHDALVQSILHTAQWWV